LINAGYGEDISFSYEQGLPNACGFVIAENIDADKKDGFIKMVDDTIKDIIDNGIDKDILMSSINTAYLNACEANPGSYTRGVRFALESLDSYSNGYGVDNFIKYKDAFNALYKEDLSSNDNIFTKRLREMFVDCENKCVTVVSPKKDYQKEKNKELQDILKKRKEAFLKKDKDAMKKLVQEYDDYKKARAKEDNPEALASVPKLSIDDIPKDVKLITSDEKEIYGKKVISTEEKTGELVYIGVDYKLPIKGEDFPDSEKYLLTIATALLGSLDTKNYTYDELCTLMDMYTGGITFSTSLNDVQPILRINTKTKKENIDKTYEIINEILYNTKYDDTDRIKQKLAEYKIASDYGVSDYANNASMYRAGAKYSYAYELTDKMKVDKIGFNM
ncbi:MAG: hypothetical protein MJ151_04375, partial [Lachnospiraceae bacterium]|nr:hypothetical protein [Lachnospiraceae bacterium]